MFRLVCLLIGYAIGCFQTAYIVGRASGGIDIRSVGSGNAGVTNVVRVLGAKAGAVVFATDILKGALAVVLCSLIFGGQISFANADSELLHLPALYAGIGVILGHSFPFYLKFKGGKGIASTIGFIFCLDFRIALIAHALAVAGGFATAFVSVGSLILTAVTPIMAVALGYSPEEVLLTLAVTALAYYGHRQNIVRLVKGTENKFSIKKKG